MLAKKYEMATAERRWQEFWRTENVYAFDPEADGEVFSIDTPPPTVSGSLHIGHIFSYTQAEMVARFQRLRGRNVFYPLGFDDNGLPTERLVEKEHGLRATAVSRSQFTKLCYETAAKYEADFRELFQAMGFSVDWSLTYETVSPRVQRLAQRSFLELVRRDKAYHKESPVLWCPQCSTSIAQAELESAEHPSAFHWLAFSIGGGEVEVATTRPELLYGCVALFIHPDDKRFCHYIGASADVPLFGHSVPVVADHRVAMDKGSGIVMCCTFGDTVDLEWFLDYQLPYRRVILADGVVDSEVPIIGGMTVTEARQAMVDALHSADLLRRQEDIVHSVAVHERCGTPTEIIPSRQWYINVLKDKQLFLDAADQIRWYPNYMKERYRIWVQNLKWDWCISRQRYFGVPFPVWYCQDCGDPVFASERQLPVNPLEDQPEIHCACGGTRFHPESAVMDTWATSSLTPLINARWQESGDWTERLVPMSMRTQAHEIIRTWAFYTIVKQLYHTGTIPWRDIMICGFVLAKRGEKLSKSKGNASLAPSELVQTYGADGLRYWAATSRLGTDSTFSVNELQASQRFLTKLWNAAKFALMHLEDFAGSQIDCLTPVDRWLIERCEAVKHRAAGLLEQYEVGAARQEVDQFFWHDFCDDYLEIVKDRLYNPEARGREQRRSAQSALHYVLLELLKLYGIFVPHITEEIYQAYYRDQQTAASLHQTHLAINGTTDAILLHFGEACRSIVAQVRKHKSDRNMSLKEPIAGLSVAAPTAILPLLQEAQADLLACTKSARITWETRKDLTVEVLSHKD